jgi:hypothetical protein
MFAPKPCRAQILGASTATRLAIALLTTGLALLATAEAGANATPRLRAGLWQFDRELEIDGTRTARRLIDNLLVSPRETRCVDPGATVWRSRPLFLGHCRVTRPKSDSDDEDVTLTYCGPGEPVRSERKVESDTAYTEIHAGRIGASATRDIVVARRIGDCHR